MNTSKLPQTVVVASDNADKIAEIKKIFYGIKFISMREAGFKGKIEENGKTFKENAFIKAQAVYNELKLPVIADDSGLCVDALDGAPGVYSARFSGGDAAENRAYLLKRLDGVSHREAHFACAVCLIDEKGKPRFGEGETHGRILFEEIGSRGFGYDSLFFSNDLNKCFGEADEEEKNAVSHRFRALNDLRKQF